MWLWGHLQNFNGTPLLQSNGGKKIQKMKWMLRLSCGINGCGEQNLPLLLLQLCCLQTQKIANRPELKIAGWFTVSGFGGKEKLSSLVISLPLPPPGMLIILLANYLLKTHPETKDHLCPGNAASTWGGGRGSSSPIILITLASTVCFIHAGVISTLMEVFAQRATCVSTVKSRRQKREEGRL